MQAASCPALSSSAHDPGTFHCMHRFIFSTSAAGNTQQALQDTDIATDILADVLSAFYTLRLVVVVLLAVCLAMVLLVAVMAIMSKLHGPGRGDARQQSVVQWQYSLLPVCPTALFISIDTLIASTFTPTVCLTLCTFMLQHQPVRLCQLLQNQACVIPKIDWKQSSSCILHGNL